MTTAATLFAEAGQMLETDANGPKSPHRTNGEARLPPPSTRNTPENPTRKRIIGLLVDAGFTEDDAGRIAEKMQRGDVLPSVWAAVESAAAPPIVRPRLF